QQSRIELQTAVVIQPLTQEQIDAYLASAGEQLMGIRQALRTDLTLQALASTPLMLSILSLTYREKPVESLHIAENTTEMQQQIFEAYVHRMLERQGTGKDYTPAQTIRYLTWIAKQLSLHNQTEFYAERIQRDWLPKRWTHWLYICAG